MNNNLKYLLLFGLVTMLLGIFASTTDVWYDDAGHWRHVVHLAESGDRCNLINSETGECDPLSAYLTLGPALQYPVALILKFLGTEMWKARMSVIPFAICFLVVFFLLARKMLNEDKATLTLLLVAGNIQFLTYGSQLLGEVPMLCWLFCGFYFQYRAINGEARLKYGVLAWIMWSLAILTKEYIAVPIGLALLVEFILRVRFREIKVAKMLFLQGVWLPLLPLIWYVVSFNSWELFLEYMEHRSGYGSEFFGLEIIEPVRFLLFKPLIIAGTIALGVKIYFRGSAWDRFLGTFHVVQVLLFLLSAGYDRMGFQLLFIPAIYLSEFILFAWKSAKGRGFLMKVGFVALFLALFTQQTFPMMVNRLLNLDTTNQAERKVGERLLALGINKVFTYDEQLIPFLPDGINFRLEREIPANSDDCQPLILQDDEVLVSGIYARTEFPQCVKWEELTSLDSSGVGEERFIILTKLRPEY